MYSLRGVFHKLSQKKQVFIRRVPLHITLTLSFDTDIREQSYNRSHSSTLRRERRSWRSRSLRLDTPEAWHRAS